MNIAFDMDCIFEEVPASLTLKSMKPVMMFDKEARMKSNLVSDVLLKN